MVKQYIQAQKRKIRAPNTPRINTEQICVCVYYKGTNIPCKFSFCCPSSDAYDSGLKSFCRSRKLKNRKK